MVVLCGLAACAIQEAPSGGPADTRPPQITGTFPEADSSGVSTETEIRLEFDESMKKTRFERFVTTHPRIAIGKTGWSKTAFVLLPEEPLHPDTTYIVELQGGYSDSHGVPNPTTFEFAFATSAAIDSGVVSGHVFFRRQPSQTAVVRLFVLPKDSAFAPEETLADRQATVSPDGSFELGYLPTDDRDFVIWAFEDTDDNGSYTPEQDVGAERPDTVSLAAGTPLVDDMRILIVDPKEPAKIVGKIINSTGIDTMPVTLAIHAVTDTAPPTYTTRSTPDGDYSFVQVLKGQYTLFAFVDFQSDSLCGNYACGPDSTSVCIEPCVQYPDTLIIEPGQQITLEELILESAGGSEKDEE